jgi:hypothetical protein
MRNISFLCTRKNSQTWGPNAWEKVVVCIVADGRKKIHPRVLDCLTLLGVYQPGDHMKNMVNNKEVTAHLFEYTTSFALDPNLHFKYPDKGIVPCQIIFCLKEKNQRKINSHRWFFNAFGPMLQVSVHPPTEEWALTVTSRMFACFSTSGRDQVARVSTSFGKRSTSTRTWREHVAKLLSTRARTGHFS